VDDAPLCCFVRDNGAGFDPEGAGGRGATMYFTLDASEVS
jgi:hypothetical protein